MPSAVPNGTLKKSDGIASTTATVRAHGSRCSKPQPVGESRESFYDYDDSYKARGTDAGKRVGWENSPD